MTQEEALSILKTGANVFLTGEPGSGKTHTINRFTSWLSARNIEPAITASTGIAATHIGGYTIHSWSGIGIKKRLTDWDLDAIAQNKRLSERIRSAHVLIIDEVSMLSAKVFGMAEAVCRAVRGGSRPFGGLQVILVGDFFQLPPIAERPEEGADELFEESPTSNFAFASEAWKRLEPLVCYLSEQHRQEDAPFLELLSAIRKGAVETKHRTLLESRFTAQAQKGSVTQLFSHNADVNSINERELSKLGGEAKEFVMESRGAERLTETLKRGCLSPERLALTRGARVMFTKNDTHGQRFVNGTLGTVEGFGSEGYPLVKTFDGRMLVAEPVEWNLTEGGRTLASITQVPLRLAWAMTVHKSQGMSLDAARMDLSHAFEYGQGYVALSRVRTLAGLSLQGFNERALEVHPDILEKDDEFRTASETAVEAFAKLPQKELQQMHDNYVKAFGGTLPDKTSAKAIPKKKSLSGLRKKHPNAYRAWSSEEDADLKRRFGLGEKQSIIAEALGRQRGAIASRLVKLGLVEE